MTNISVLNDMKSVYDFGVSVNWDAYQMIEYARSYAYSLKDIKKLVQSYVTHNWTTVSHGKSYNLFMDLNFEEIHDEFILNPVLLKKGIRTCHLWENEEEKEEILKYIYDAWNDTNLSKQNLCDMFHIYYDKLNELLFMYARDYLKMSFEE